MEKIRNFFIMGLIVLVFAACGPKKVDITVDMKEYTFEPVTVEVPAGAEVTLTLINDGTLEHEFVIMNLGTEISAPFNEDDEPNIYWEHELEPASSAVVTFTAPGEPGVYQVGCGIPEHLEQGMVAELVVK